MKGRLEHSLKIENNINNLLFQLPEYITEYYYEFKSGRQPSACLEYIRKINVFLNYISNDVKNVKPQDISKLCVSKFLNSIEYITNKDGIVKQTSLAYRKSYYSILKSLFNFLVENNYLDENPMNKIKRIKGEDYVNRKFLTENELKSILSTIDYGAGNRRCVSMQKKWKNRDKAILMILIQTGMRETALTEINMEDIDFDEHIIKSVIEKGHKIKTFTMCKQLENVLMDWIYDRSEIINEGVEDALFISKSKTRISQKSVLNIVKKYTKEALGYSVSPHKIRASFANIMLDKTNQNIYVVQQLLGHARTETTKIYLKNNLNKYNDMAAKVISDSIFS